MTTPPTTGQNRSLAEHIRNLRPLIALEQRRWELRVQGDEDVASRLKKTEESLELLRPEIDALGVAAAKEFVAGTLASTLDTINAQTRPGVFDSLNTSTARAQSSADDIPKVPEDDRDATIKPVRQTQDQSDQLPNNTSIHQPKSFEQTNRQSSTTPSVTRRVEVLEQSMESLREDVGEMRADVSKILGLMRGMAAVNISAPSVN